jgi:hypothetical protein
MAMTPLVAYASVSVTPDDTAAVAGGVYALADAGDRVIVGGTFTKMGGKVRGNVAAVRADGTVDPAFVPSTDGKVAAVAVSEDGQRVFVGGKFTTVNGVPRANLAAVDATTGAVIDSWTADTVGTNPDVKTLAVEGNRLYVGGRFGGIDGTTRKRMAAIDTNAGDVVTTFSPRPDLGVNEILVSPDGSVVWAGGAFTKLGGAIRDNHAGAVFAANGDATPFAPTVSGGNAVTIGLSPDGSRFFFSTDNNTLLAYDHAVSNDPVWSVKTSGNTQAIAVSDTELYIGGHFSQFVTGKIKRNYIASVDPVTGTPTAWDPNAAGGKMGVWALLIEGSHLHAGGVFSSFNTVSHRGYARFTGTP